MDYNYPWNAQIQLRLYAMDAALRATSGVDVTTSQLIGLAKKILEFVSSTATPTATATTPGEITHE